MSYDYINDKGLMPLYSFEYQLLLSKRVRKNPMP